MKPKEFVIFFRFSRPKSSFGSGRSNQYKEDFFRVSILLAEFKIRWLYPLQIGKNPLQKECLWYDIKLHLMMRLQF